MSRLNSPWAHAARRFLKLSALLLGGTPALAGCEAAAETVRARLLMGTVLEIRVRQLHDYKGDSGDPAPAVEAAYAEVAALEAAVSTWQGDSELALIHRAGPGPHPVSERLAATLDAAFALRDESGGAFDPAVGALIAAYDLHGAGRWPAPARLRQVRRSAGRGAFSWDGKTKVLMMLLPGARLDLDGIAKGLALDRAGAILRAAGITDALLNFGGQLLLIGPPESCPPRTVEIAASGGPKNSSRPPLTAALRDVSVSTSGNSERGRRVNGRHQGHLLDPRTGRFAPYRGSVTVVAPTGAMADGYSTALFILGDGPFAARLRGRGIAIAFMGGGSVAADALFTSSPQPQPQPSQ